MEQEVKDTFPVRLAVVDGDWRYLSNIRDYAALHTGIQQCDTYRNSMELLDALSAGILYHGVIMDLFLQDSTPNVFLDRLNRRNIPNRPVLVFTTTSINRTLAESVLLAGADQVIQKPPRAQDLLCSPRFIFKAGCESGSGGTFINFLFRRTRMDTGIWRLPLNSR